MVPYIHLAINITSELQQSPHVVIKFAMSAILLKVLWSLLKCQSPTIDLLEPIFSRECRKIPKILAISDCCHHDGKFLPFSARIP